VRAAGKIRLGEFLLWLKQAHGDKESGKKDAGISIRRLTDDTIWHGGDNSYGKDADPPVTMGAGADSVVWSLRFPEGTREVARASPLSARRNVPSADRRR
jgi:hypothetical protein